MNDANVRGGGTQLRNWLERLDRRLGDEATLFWIVGLAGGRREGSAGRRACGGQSALVASDGFRAAPSIAAQSRPNHRLIRLEPNSAFSATRSSEGPTSSPVL